jgi:hypothetical protein
MKGVWKLFIVFIAWSLIILTPFALLVLAFVPEVVIGKPFIIVASLVIIVCAVFVKVFDPAFTKKVTSATGK